MDNSSALNDRFEITPHVGGIPLAVFGGGIAFFVFLLLAYYVNPLFYLAAACLILPLLYINKTAALYLYVLAYAYTLPLLPFRAQIRLDDFFFVILASIWFMDKALTSNKNISKTLITRLLLIWLVINALSVLVNFPHFSTFQILRSGFFLTRMIEYILVYFIVSDMLKTLNMKIVMIRLIWLITLFICLVGLYQFHVLGWSTVTSTLSINHAHIGVFLVFTFFIFLGYASFTNNLLEKFIIILILPLMVYIIFLSASRAGILALVFGILVYFIFLRKFYGWIIAAILIFVVIYIGINFIQELHEYKLGVAKFEDLEQDISLMGRFYIWYETIDMIRQNPSVLITGVGLGAFRFAVSPHTPFFAGASGAHNNYLHHLTETGILGFGIFIYLLFILFKISLKRSREKIRYDKSLYFGYFCGLAALAFSATTQEVFSVQTSHHNFLGYVFLITALVFTEPSKMSNQFNKSEQINYGSSNL